MDGRQEQGLFGPFRHEKGHQFSFWSQVFDEIENGLACGPSGADEIDFFIVDQAVSEKSDPVALPDWSAWGQLTNFVIETKPMANL